MTSNHKISFGVAMMVLLFTPYTYVFSVFYVFFLISLMTLSNFYSYWLSMELLTLLLMGISYTVFSNSVSQLMVYFLVQSLSSFLILLSYLISSSLLLTGALLLKLGMFPFMSWYLSSVMRFPNFIFWLTGTCHKIPPVLMISQFNLVLHPSTLWGSVILTTLFSGVLMVLSADFRYLLVASSAGNNSWFLLSCMSNFTIFIIFTVIYSLFMFFLLAFLGELVKPSRLLSSQSSTSSLWLWFGLLCLSGLPPFPMFFVKMVIIYSLFLSNLLTYLFIPFLLFACVMVAGYLSFLMGHMIRQYSTPVNFYL